MANTLQPAKKYPKSLWLLQKCCYAVGGVEFPIPCPVNGNCGKPKLATQKCFTRLVPNILYLQGKHTLTLVTRTSLSLYILLQGCELGMLLWASNYLLNQFRISFLFVLYNVICDFLVFTGATPYPGMGAREVMRRVRDGYRSAFHEFYTDNTDCLSSKHIGQSYSKLWAAAYQTYLYFNFLYC